MKAVLFSLTAAFSLLGSSATTSINRQDFGVDFNQAVEGVGVIAVEDVRK